MSCNAMNGCVSVCVCVCASLCNIFALVYLARLTRLGLFHRTETELGSVAHGTRLSRGSTCKASVSCLKKEAYTYRSTIQPRLFYWSALVIDFTSLFQMPRIFPDAPSLEVWRAKCKATRDIHRERNAGVDRVLSSLPSKSEGCVK